MEQKTTVLVVEDDAHLLSGIRDILELEEYVVLTAQNGREGLKVLHENPEEPPDVIVSDIMMPHMDGFSFLEEVRKEDRWITVPFIFLTAKGEKTDRYRGSRLGADEYLTKPFDAEDLLVAVSSSLKRHRRIRAVQNDQVSGLKRKILTILNHEFRTPLTLVVAYADMLKDFDQSSMSEDEVMLFLKGVNSGADRLRRLIENFIILVEIEQGDAARTYEWRNQKIENLASLVDAACHQIDVPDQRPRKFEFDIAKNLPSFKGDAQFMTVVLREMLDNGAKFSDDHSTVSLSAHYEAPYIVVQVRDEGRGIAEAELENIWQPFYQIERELYEDQGAGSGLAIIDGLISIHGGYRSVESQPGVGSCFTIGIPAALS